MMIERFDLDADAGALDWTSCQALIELTDLQRARAQLRARWMLRTLLDALPDFHLDQIGDTFANDMKGSP